MIKPLETNADSAAEPRGEFCVVGQREESLRKPRVLLVDDEQSILSSLKRLLRREGYDITTASCGAEALERFDEGSFDLVISDFRMPGMTGTELLGQVHERFPDTIRIILSGYSEVNAILEAVNTGAIYKYLTKPWNDEEIKLHLRRAIEQQRLETANRNMADEIARQNDELRQLNRQLGREAADANLGLNFTQELMDYIDAGVLCVDSAGLVVNANRRMCELLPSGTVEVIGMPKREVLPAVICDVLPDDLSDIEASGDCLELDGRTLQWRSRPFLLDGQVHGQVMTLWEVVR